MYIDETFAEKFLFTNTSFERELSLKTLSCPADQKARRLRMRLSIDHIMDVQHQVAGSQTS